jgi:hypothetical protein
VSEIKSTSVELFEDSQSMALGLPPVDGGRLAGDHNFLSNLTIVVPLWTCDGAFDGSFRISAHHLRYLPCAPSRMETFSTFDEALRES